MANSAITITWCDRGENHAGMQKIGTLATDGFSVDELKEIKGRFEENGASCELVVLSNPLQELGTKVSSLPRLNYTLPEAAILIIRDGYKKMGLAPIKTRKELTSLEWDTKMLSRGAVKNKIARHNLCFSDFDQEPNYEKGKGRVVSFPTVPNLEACRAALPLWFGDKAQDLVAEGNYYYDVKKCYIGYHGDAERRRVIGTRFGPGPEWSSKLDFQWYYQYKPVEEGGAGYCSITLNSGDVYVMSEIAVGTDWRRKNIYILRHSAYFEKNA